MKRAWRMLPVDDELRGVLCTCFFPVAPSGTPALALGRERHALHGRSPGLAPPLLRVAAGVVDLHGLLGVAVELAHAIGPESVKNMFFMIF